jgi:CorA-like Mg2+ transporter protein
VREVVNALLRHRKDFNAPTELDAHYDDLYDHVLRAAEWTESLRDMITTLFATNLSLQDTRLTTVVKKLNGWAAIIAVPTAVTGYFGQTSPTLASAKRSATFSAASSSSYSPPCSTSPSRNATGSEIGSQPHPGIRLHGLSCRTPKLGVEPAEFDVTAYTAGT